MGKHDDIRNDRRYKNMTYDAARLVVAVFHRDFGDMTPDQLQAHPDGPKAYELWALAVGWLVLNDRWQGLVDPEFVAMLMMKNEWKARMALVLQE